MTGFQKTDQSVTLGLFHFIGPANGYNRTLHTVWLQIFDRENIREKHYFLINRNFWNKIFVNWCHFREDSD